jgi:hypothetical protein
MLAGVDFMVLSPAVLASLRGAPTMQARTIRAVERSAPARAASVAKACCQPALGALRSGHETTLRCC